MAYKYANTSSYRRSQRASKKRKMPFRGKTGTHAKPGTKSFVKRVKSVILKTCEPKHTPVAVTKIEVFHNLMLGQTYLLNQAGVMPTVGSIQQSSRIGDQIVTSGWKIRCLFGQKADRPNVSWRFMVFQIPILCNGLRHRTQQIVSMLGLFHIRCRKTRNGNHHLLFLHSRIQSLLDRQSDAHAIIKPYGVSSEDPLKDAYPLHLSE
jgi:hypothetical protein